MAGNKLTVLLLALLMATAAVATASAHDDEADEEHDDDEHDEDDRDADEHDEDGRDEDDHDDDHDEDGRDEDDHDDDHDEDDRDDGEFERREVEVEADDEGVSFELERETARSEDKIEAGFDFEDASFEVEYEAEEGQNETETSLEATFETLLEYRDSDGDGKYSAGDEVVSAYGLGEDSEGFDLDGRADWQTPTISDIAQDNKTGKRIDAPARIGDNGTFELRFYVFGDFVELGNASLEPTSIKVDIVIEDYPYQANDTALALILETASETEFEHDHDDVRDDEQGVAAGTLTGGRNVSLVFTWKTFADVDGDSTDVSTTLLGMKEEREIDEDGSEHKVEERFALSYARGDHIVHDPEARLSIQSGSGETRDVPLPAVGLLLVPMVALAVLRRWRS